MPKTAPPKTLVVQPLIKGNGPKVGAGDLVTFDYAWYTWDGKLVESSYAAEPGSAELAKLLPGLRKGLVNQTVGSRVLLVVPPADGYPNGNASPKIEKNTTWSSWSTSCSARLSSSDQSTIQGCRGSRAGSNRGSRSVSPPARPAAPSPSDTASQRRARLRGPCRRAAAVGQGDRPVPLGQSRPGRVDGQRHVRVRRRGQARTAPANQAWLIADGRRSSPRTTWSTCASASSTTTARLYAKPPSPRRTTKSSTVPVTSP